MSDPTETLWHVTVLSNFARGYDKYARTYSKAGIPESTFPDRFFLLQETELHAGVAKDRRLLERLALPASTFGAENDEWTILSSLRCPP